MNIEENITLTEDISDYYGDMNPEMYFDKKDIEEFVDRVLAEVIESTGKEDLCLFNIYLSDGDRLVISLEDKDNVFPIEIKIDPMKDRTSRGIFKYLNTATSELVNKVNEYKDLFEMALKVNESVEVDFDEWADRIIFDEYRTVAKLRKFGKEHPEHKKDILSLKDQIRNIYSNAYLESIDEKPLKEDFQPESSDVLERVIENYGVFDKPQKGPSFILPDGQYLDLSTVTNHSDVEYWLDQQGLSIKADYNRRSGSPTLRSLGCIRVDTPKYYIQLPEDNITSEQYAALKDWIEFVFVECQVPFIEVIAAGTSPVRYRYEDEVDADYIVDRIRRYYITDHLYEAHEDLAEGPYIKESTVQDSNMVKSLDRLVNEAHYGGAFDIRDDEYFTRDDLNELTDYVESTLNEKIVDDKVSITDADITNQILNLEITSDKDGFMEEYHKKIDMRKIRLPKDLIRTYGKDAVNEFKKKFESDGVEFSLEERIDESLTDVVSTAPYVIVPSESIGEYKYVTPEGDIIVIIEISEDGLIKVSETKDYFDDTYSSMRKFESDLNKYLESEEKE